MTLNARYTICWSLILIASSSCSSLKSPPQTEPPQTEPPPVERALVDSAPHSQSSLLTFSDFIENPDNRGWGIPHMEKLASLLEGKWRGTGQFYDGSRLTASTTFHPMLLENNSTEYLQQTLRIDQSSITDVAIYSWDISQHRYRLIGLSNSSCGKIEVYEQQCSENRGAACSEVCEKNDQCPIYRGCEFRDCQFDIGNDLNFLASTWSCSDLRKVLYRLQIKDLDTVHESGKFRFEVTTCYSEGVDCPGEWDEFYYLDFDKVN